MKPIQIRAVLLTIACSIGIINAPVFAQSESSNRNDWARETIMLPPGFAPEFPLGVEELRFPPGWRNPDSENFWSYAIVLRLDESEPSIDRLRELTHQYYTGLMAAFGVGRDPNGLPNTVDVQLNQTEQGAYLGTMRLVDGFATKKHITVNLKIRSWAQSNTTSVLEFRVSPQEDSHAIWKKLQSAIEAMINDQPIQHFAHFPQGEWRAGIRNGSQQRDVWSWGPSRRSLTSITTNSKDTSESIFGSFRMIYDNPQRDDLTVIALDTPELIQAGTVKVNTASNFRFDMELLYDVERIEWAIIPKRAISSDWVFSDPANYVHSWVEDMGQPVEPGSVAWPYFNHPERTPMPPSASKPPQEILYLSAFFPLLESQWETEYSRTSFEWIPYNEAVLMRTMDTHAGVLIEEAVFYPNPITKQIHAVSVHSSGAVDEGFASIDGDAIVIRA
ncbi:MAG: hypothetical protein JJ974_09340, partial [Phycisphaerales bacterium]|nr:hypothetical protein [Phycisphaerales bacterium]